MWKVRVKNMHRTAALLSLAAIFSASSASASVFILDSFDTPPISHVSTLASAPLPIANDNGPNLPAGANTRDLVGRGPLLGGGVAPAFGINTTYIALFSIIVFLLLYYVWILNANATK